MGKIVSYKLREVIVNKKKGKRNEIHSAKIYTKSWIVSCAQDTLQFVVEDWSADWKSLEFTSSWEEKYVFTRIFLTIKYREKIPPYLSCIEQNISL